MIPYPTCQIFAGRVFETFHVVQVVVIELVMDRLEGGFDVGKVHYPPRLRPDQTCYVDFDLERMTMQTCALVPDRHIGQSMRRFQREEFKNLQDVRPFPLVVFQFG